MSSVVPTGIISDIVTVPVPFPEFVAINLYVIVSNSCNGVAEPSLDFVVVMFATFVSTSPVGIVPTVAVFFTDFTGSFCCVSLLYISLFTVTSKLTVTSSPAGTVTFSHIIVPSSETTASPLAEPST